MFVQKSIISQSTKSIVDLILIKEEFESDDFKYFENIQNEIEKKLVDFEKTFSDEYDPIVFLEILFSLKYFILKMKPKVSFIYSLGQSKTGDNHYENHIKNT